MRWSSPLKRLKQRTRGEADEDDEIPNWDPKGKNTPLVLSVISSLITDHILLSPPQCGVWKRGMIGKAIGK